MNGQVEIDRGRMVLELIGRPSVVYANRIVAVRRVQCMQEAGVSTYESG